MTGRPRGGIWLAAGALALVMGAWGMAAGPTAAAKAAAAVKDLAGAAAKETAAALHGAAGALETTAKKHGGGEANIVLPDLAKVVFNVKGVEVRGVMLMHLGLGVCVIGLLFGLYQYTQIKNLPVHESMAAVSQTIWETCKTYLFQQGKFLAVLWLLIAGCIYYYYGSLQAMNGQQLGVILAASILGILGSYGVAWFGIRINTRANCRAAFAALKSSPVQAMTIPMKSGMSVGLLLVSVELFFMICILTFLPLELVGPCFIGFAIGESLGASALRICGGIFTKIADIGSDLT